MRNGHKAMGMRQKWMSIVVVLAALLVTSAEPVYAWRGSRHGGHGYRYGGHGYRHGGYGYRHGGHGYRPYIRPYIAFSIGPYWGPYWGPYGYSSVVVTPPPQVYVQPAPPASVPPPPAQSPAQPQPSWYYCENPQGYYPYVQQCPGGWQPVAPTPPSP